VPVAHRARPGAGSTRGLTAGGVTLHTLRHTALMRMIAAGCDDYAVLETSGHSPTRMLARYTQPTKEGRCARWTCRAWAQSGHNTTKPLATNRQRPL